MRSWMTPRAGAATLALAFLVACGGGQTVPSFISPASSLTNDARFAPMANGTIPTCKAPFQKIPGTYATMFSFDGKISGSTFTSGPKSFWFAFKFVKGTAPTPTPSTGPTPKPQLVYYYYGTYKLKKYGTGCAILIASVNGKPLHGFKPKTNVESLGTPQFKNGDGSELQFTDTGKLVMSVKNLSANGGSGTLSLSDGNGLADGGPVTFIGRATVTLNI
jgi:hypothetical protein